MSWDSVESVVMSLDSVEKCSASRGIVWENVVYVVGLCGKM